jgi:hypothetical protein
MRTTFLSGLFLCLLVGWVWGVASQPVAGERPQRDGAKPVLDSRQDSQDSVESAVSVSLEKDTLGPIEVFADIEEAWKKEKVEQILRHYGKGKVSIAIEGIGPTGGAFSKNQSHYLFKDLFKYTITTKFEFVQYRKVSDDHDKVYAVAERTYKRNDDGRLFEDKIYVSLHMEDDLWVISEIKSVR